MKKNVYRRVQFEFPNLAPTGAIRQELFDKVISLLEIYCSDSVNIAMQDEFLDDSRLVKIFLYWDKPFARVTSVNKHIDPKQVIDNSIEWEIESPCSKLMIHQLFAYLWTNLDKFLLSKEDLCGNLERIEISKDELIIHWVDAPAQQNVRYNTWTRIEIKDQKLSDDQWLLLRKCLINAIVVNSERIVTNYFHDTYSARHSRENIFETLQLMDGSESETDPFGVLFTNMRMEKKQIIAFQESIELYLTLDNLPISEKEMLSELAPLFTLPPEPKMVRKVLKSKMDSYVEAASQNKHIKKILDELYKDYDIVIVPDEEVDGKDIRSLLRANIVNFDQMFTDPEPFNPQL